MVHSDDVETSSGGSDLKRVGLDAFYQMMLARDGISDAPALIGGWSAESVELVQLRFRTALLRCGIVGSILPNFQMTDDGAVRTNQSKGNVAADALAVALSCDPASLIIDKLEGSGYPDRLAVVPNPDFSCCFEIKATSAWSERDSNRRVLTSSPTKILGAIRSGRLPPSPCHLIGTVLYDRDSGEVGNVRLDFLEPDSPVNVRLEASTSHRLLSEGQHRSVLLG